MASNQHALIVVIEIENKWNKVAIFDATDTSPERQPIGEGEGSKWRTALGEALSQIELGAPRKSINDIKREKEEGEGNENS